MNIPSQDEVVTQIQSHFDSILTAVSGKKIFYEGKLLNGKRLILCTPQSKVYNNDRAWVDLTEKQTTILQNAEYSVVAFRVEGGAVYYIDFHLFKPYLTERAKVFNLREGHHWKLYIFPSYIEVYKNSHHFRVLRNDLNNLQLNGMS